MPFEKLFPVDTRGSPVVWSVTLPLQVPWEQDCDSPLGQLGLLEGGTAGLLQENLPSLQWIVPDNVPAWQDSRSSNSYINKPKHMTQDRKFGLLGKIPFLFCKVIKVPES